MPYNTRIDQCKYYGALIRDNRKSATAENVIPRPRVSSHRQIRSRCSRSHVCCLRRDQPSCPAFRLAL